MTEKPKILIADDEPSLRLLVRATLEDEDYQIVEAADGTTALDAIRVHQPTLVFLDVGMPGMTGLEVCQAIKEDPELNHIKVVMLTAKSQPRDFQRGRAAGADQYLTKPFSPLQLIDLVESVVSQ